MLLPRLYRAFPPCVTRFYFGMCVSDVAKTSEGVEIELTNFCSLPRSNTQFGVAVGSLTVANVAFAVKVGRSTSVYVYEARKAFTSEGVGAPGTGIDGGTD